MEIKMRSEKEINEKYEVMLLNTEKLKRIIDNPTNDEIKNIQKHVDNYHEQLRYNDLIEWVKKLK
jgi:hypothetical protein